MDEESQDDMPEPGKNSRFIRYITEELVTKVASSTLTVTAKDPWSGQTFTMELSSYMSWDVIKTLLDIGPEAAVGLVRLVTEPLLYGDTEYRAEPPIKYHARLRAVLYALHKLAIDEQWKAETDQVISLCYHLLRERKINRRNAADLASLLLKKETSTETWRKRVDRWVEKKGLPRVRE
jgi:hypothetical protein